jgi:hypothetical protein
LSSLTESVIHEKFAIELKSFISFFVLIEFQKVFSKRGEESRRQKSIINRCVTFVNNEKVPRVYNETFPQRRRMQIIIPILSSFIFTFRRDFHSMFEKKKVRVGENEKGKKLEFVNKIELKSSYEDIFFLVFSLLFAFTPVNVKRKQLRSDGKTNLNIDKSNEILAT